MMRRAFLSRIGYATAGSLLAAPYLARVHVRSPPSMFLFGQVPLPYAFDALEPHIDRFTMEVHYNRHHAAYVRNVNDAIEQEGIVVGDAKEFFKGASKLSEKARNNGGGAWNHDHFWQGIAPGQVEPPGRVREALRTAFGDMEGFKRAFTEVAMQRFGSGWAWLVERDGRLEVGSTRDQDNPLMDVGAFQGEPLLALDVWEHAYYLKHQDRRIAYLASWWNVVNWNAVAMRMR